MAPEHQLAHDERRPSIRKNLRRSCDWAVLLVFLHGIILARAPRPDQFENWTGSVQSLHFPRLRRLALLNGPSLSQQSHRSPLTRAAKQQRISQGRALNDLTRPLVVPRKLHANCEVCTALNQ